MKKIIALFALSIGFTSLSQDLKQEILEMNNYLGQMNSYQMTVNYLAAEGTDLEEKGQVSVVVSDSGLFYDLGLGSRMMINQDKVILIDDQERSIVYGENQKVKRRNSVNMMNQLIQGMDTLVAKADTVIFTTSGATKKYALRFDNSYFDMVELQFENKLLSKVQYYYNSDHVDVAGIKNVCTVKYTENVELDPHYLSTAFYLNESNGTTVPSENFNNYLIIYNGSLENYLD